MTDTTSSIWAAPSPETVLAGPLPQPCRTPEPALAGFVFDLAGFTSAPKDGRSAAVPSPSAEDDT